MPISFKPQSDAELPSFEVFKPGVYDFEITSAIEKKSKASGNNMIELEMFIFDNAGRKARVWDYLVFTEKTMFKVKHCCDAVGLTEDYDAGTLSGLSFEGRTGRCKVGVQQDQNGFDRNKVADYLPTTSAIAREVRKTAQAPLSKPVPLNRTVPPLDDEIPF